MSDEDDDKIARRVARMWQTRLREAEGTLAAVLELAAFFQDDYGRKLPVVAAFRQWRHGILTTEEFLELLRKDDLAEVLRHESVPPMKGLTALNDHRLTRR